MFISPPFAPGEVASALYEDDPMPDIERLVKPVERYEDDRLPWLMFALGGGLGADAGREYLEEDPELDCRLNMMVVFTTRGLKCEVDCGRDLISCIRWNSDPEVYALVLLQACELNNPGHLHSLESSTS